MPRRPTAIAAVALAATATALACLAQAVPSAAAEPLVPLKQAAGPNLLVGTCVSTDQFDDPAVVKLIDTQFDCLTPENQLKPDATEPQPGQFDFEAGDKIAAFAQAHGMKLIGHNLCWHNQTPKWMYQGPDGKPLPREQALANLKRHIDGVVGHYKGKVLGWDVVNEALSDKPGEYLRDSPARRAIGDDFIVQAFKFAHAADPDAEMYYNDYSNENPPKRASQLRLVKELQQAGCRIDAVGIQGHFELRHPGTADVVDSAITDFAAAGVKVCITELDVDVLPRKQSGANITDVQKGGVNDNPYPHGMPPEVAARQADFYGRLFAVLGRHRGEVTRVTFWGVDDGASWLNTYPVRGRANHPLLFDRDLKPKPAFDAVIYALRHPGSAPPGATTPTNDHPSAARP